MQYLKSFDSQKKNNPKRQELDINERSYLAMLLLIQTVLWFGLLVIAIYQAFRLNAIAEGHPTFVQLVNGEALYISQRERTFRSPETLRRFVTDWTTLTYNWDGKLPGSENADEGLVSPSGKKVTTDAWFASTMLEKGFAEQSLNQIALLTPAEVFSGKIQSLILPTYISEPRQTADGVWEVDMTATRQQINRQTGERKVIEVNSTFTVKAVEPPRSPLGNQASFVEQRVYQLRATGLEITKIVDFVPGK